MSIDLTMYKQEYTIDTMTNSNQIILTEMAEIHDRDLIDELDSLGQNSWYMSGDGGSIFELQGYDLIPYLEKLKLNKEDIEEEDFYRFSLSF